MSKLEVDLNSENVDKCIEEFVGEGKVIREERVILETSQGRMRVRQGDVIEKDESDGSIKLKKAFETLAQIKKRFGR